MHDGTRVMAGECTTVFEGTREREQRGDVLVVVKPDNTVLVHDAEGYQPVAWLTRAESVAVEDGTVTASDGEQFLRVVAHEEHGSARFPASQAGVPVGDCPDCSGTLVRATDEVTCTACGGTYGLPTDATVTGGRCDCRLPTMRVERGEAIECCIDRDCESLDERVRTAFDREWTCKHCGGDLCILRRGGLIAGCENYPDCDTGYAVPSGLLLGDCACGLPTFETSGGRRCLDSGCTAGGDDS